MYTDAYEYLAIHVGSTRALREVGCSLQLLPRSFVTQIRRPFPFNVP